MEPQVTTTVPSSNPNPTIYIVVVLILVIISGVIGYFFGLSSTVNKPTTLISTPPKPQGIVAKVSPLFDSQRATINGQIVSNTINSVTIKNSQGKTDEFPLSSKVLIYTPVKNKPATASADLKSIQVNKPAFIVLDFIEGKYQVSNISYPPSN